MVPASIVNLKNLLNVYEINFEGCMTTDREMG